MPVWYCSEERIQSSKLAIVYFAQSVASGSILHRNGGCQNDKSARSLRVMQRKCTVNQRKPIFCVAFKSFQLRVRHRVLTKELGIGNRSGAASVCTLSIRHTPINPALFLICGRNVWSRRCLRKPRIELVGNGGHSHEHTLPLAREHSLPLGLEQSIDFEKPVSYRTVVALQPRSKQMGRTLLQENMMQLGFPSELLFVVRMAVRSSRRKHKVVVQ